jgi:purine-nucleoside phosphorylase
LRLGDVVMAQATSTDSHMNRLRFGGRDFAPTADFGLLREAYDVARGMGINVRVGNVLSGDSFYGNDPAIRQTWIDHGVLAVEMEAAALYTLAARFGVRALAIMTVSDASAIGERMTSEQRETTLRQMIEVALAIA